MNGPIPVSNLEVQALLGAIASNAVAPGAGAAGAVVLGLAAACASKAVSVTLKHRPEDPELQSALEAFRTVALSALVEADRDSRAFEAFIHEKLPSSVERLVCEGERFGQLIAAFTTAIEEVESRIQSNMAGDVIAAKALAAAAQRIRQRNESEALELR
jgi:formiminotetrahydrofolate cyclodeaminase